MTMTMTEAVDLPGFQVRHQGALHELCGGGVPEAAPSVCGLWPRGGAWRVLYASRLPTCTQCIEALREANHRPPTKG